MSQWVRSFEAHSGDDGTKRSGQNGHSKAFAAELFFTRQLLKEADGGSVRLRLMGVAHRDMPLRIL